MRKFSYTVLGVLVVIALMSSLASGKTPPRARASVVRCGVSLYAKPCTAPALAVRTFSPACKAPGSRLTLAPIKVSDDGGLKSVTVKFGSKTVKSVKFAGAPTSRTVSGVTISTAGLTSGVAYTITIKLVDTRGKSKTKTLRFTICAPKPIFTG